MGGTRGVIEGLLDALTLEEAILLRARRLLREDRLHLITDVDSHMILVRDVISYLEAQRGISSNY